jgi:hypothetical protein
MPSGRPDPIWADAIALRGDAPGVREDATGLGGDVIALLRTLIGLQEDGIGVRVDPKRSSETRWDPAEMRSGLGWKRSDFG